MAYQLWVNLFTSAANIRAEQSMTYHFFGKPDRLYNKYEIRAELMSRFKRYGYEPYGTTKRRFWA